MRQPISPADITGLILAGGRGARMNESDKGLQLLDGKPLALHALERLAPQVGSICISANRNAEQYMAFGAPVFGDAFPDYAGPLAGIHAGLAHCATPWLVCVPCDCPALPADLVARLAAALAASDAALAFAATGSGQSHRTHPACCMLRTSLLPHLQAYLEGGGRKVSTWQAMLQSAEVHFSDAEAFRNINSLSELRDLHEARP